MTAYNMGLSLITYLRSCFALLKSEMHPGSHFGKYVCRGYNMTAYNMGLSLITYLRSCESPPQKPDAPRISPFFEKMKEMAIDSQKERSPFVEKVDRP
jgi:hypothetical protein